MKAIDGNEFVWRGIITTSALTDEYLHLTKKLSFDEGFLTVREKIIGVNNLRSIAILEKMVSISRSVVHITIPGKGVATGFMIGPDLLITNNHVFRSAADASESIVRFNYQIDLSGNFLPTDDYKCDISFFYTNPQLDYSIVRVSGEPGLKWGYMQLSPDESISVSEDVFLIQHPRGEHKQIALSDNVVAYADEEVVQYLTDTLPGSSGSPVLNDSMRVIALHNSGGWLPEPSTGSTHFRNQGTRISAIVGDMPRSASS